MENHSLFSVSKSVVVGISMSLAYIAPTIAQDSDGGFTALEEILVTGRKREESLQDIPVSISVIGSSDLADLNVLRQEDLAELVPGYHYQQGIGLNTDRTAAVASIRGIGSNDLNTNRTKVATFIDGFPILGSIGAVNIGGSTQVEVYRGPQSAAFGRSTFAGAINYVTAEPGDTYEGTATLNWSDQGTRRLSGSFGGPITENLGFHLAGNIERSEPPSDAYTMTDGVNVEDEQGENFSARFVFTPNDKFTAKLTFAKDVIEDGIRADFYASGPSSYACFTSMDLIPYSFSIAGMTMAGVIPNDGVYDCELDIHPDTVLEQLNDYQHFFDNNPDVLDDIINNGYDNGDPAADYVAQPSLVSQGATDGYLGLSLEEQVRIVYDGYSVLRDNSGASSDRDRVMAQFDYLFDNSSQMQLSLMTSEEEIFRGYSRVAEQEVQPIYWDNVNNYYTNYADPDGIMGMAMQNGRRNPDNDITAIEETYAELRWASPAEERLRYVVGASYYDYEYIYSEFGAPGYNNLVNGTDDLFIQLINPAELGNSGGIVAPTTIASEITTNTAMFFNASYDFTDTITGSFEGRYANDDVGAVLDNLSDSVKQSTFTPRVALNYSPTGDTTYYVQYSVGVNPAGINANLLDPLLRDTLDNGIPVDDTIYGGSINQNITSVNYDSSQYASFDEEKLTNYEFGFKGTALDGRFTYTGAFYYMLWDDRLENINLGWDYTYADDNLEGTLVTDEIPTGPAGVYYVGETDFTSVNQIFTNTGQTETKGFELQANYQLTDSWSLSGNGAFMTTEYTDYCSVDDYLGATVGGYPEQGTIAGLTEGVSEGGNPCWILDGLDVPNQPELSLTIIPRYRTELGDGYRFNASATFRHTSEHYQDYANIRKRAALNRVNLNLSLAKDSWSASLYVDNLLDDRSLYPGRPTSLSRFTDLNNPATVAPEYQYLGPDGVQYGVLSFQQNEGRMIGARLSYTF